MRSDPPPWPTRPWRVRSRPAGLRQRPAGTARTATTGPTGVRGWSASPGTPRVRRAGGGRGEPVRESTQVRHCSEIHRREGGNTVGSTETPGGGPTPATSARLRCCAPAAQAGQATPAASASRAPTTPCRAIRALGRCRRRPATADPGHAPGPLGVRRRPGRWRHPLGRRRRGPPRRRRAAGHRPAKPAGSATWPAGWRSCAAG